MIFGTTHRASLQILCLNVQKKNPYFLYICLCSFNETLHVITISKHLYITSFERFLGSLSAKLNLFAWQLSIGHLGSKLIWEVSLNMVYGGPLCNWENIYLGPDRILMERIKATHTHPHACMHTRMSISEGFQIANGHHYQNPWVFVDNVIMCTWLC